MIVRMKILLLWLLALAIPVQGFAAVAQGCAPTMMVQTLQMMPDMSDTSNTPNMQMHHQHHDGAAQMMMDMTMAHADASASASAHPNQQHKAGACSACATCTVGALLPLALGSLPAPDLPSREYLARPSAGFVGYTPENPDRPPALA